MVIRAARHGMNHPAKVFMLHLGTVLAIEIILDAYRGRLKERGHTGG